MIVFPQCEAERIKKENTDYIIDYQGKKYIIPYWDISGKMRDVYENVPKEELTNILQEVDFTLHEQVRGEPFLLLLKQGYFAPEANRAIAFLLKTKALEDYKQ